MKQASFPGEELRERREAKGLSPTDVYRKLRIPVRCLEDLEQGNLEALPPSTYVVGFLKTYCILLEVDPERYVDLFRASENPQPGRFLRRKGSDGGSERPKWVGEMLTWATICAVLALGWLTYQVVVRPDAAVTEGQVEAGSPDLEMAVPPAPDVDSWED